MKYASTFLLVAAVLSAQALKPGTPAPPIAAPPLDAARPFPGWESFRGNFVIVDFWATWCGPCLPGLDKIAALEKEFVDQHVRFLTVASDTSDRVKKYFTEKELRMQTFVEAEDDRRTSGAFGVHTIPAVAVIDRDGDLIAVTPGEKVTAGLFPKPAGLRCDSASGRRKSEQGF